MERRYPFPEFWGLAGWDCITVAQSVSKGWSELMSLWAPGETIWQPSVSLLASWFPYLRIQSCSHKYTTNIWDMFTRGVGLRLTMQYSWFLFHCVFVCVCICVIGSVGCIELQVTSSSHEKSPARVCVKTTNRSLILNVSHIFTLFVIHTCPNCRHVERTDVKHVTW